MIVRRLLAPDAEPGGAHPRTRHTFCPDVLAVDREASEGAPQIVERQAGVDERTEDHVAGRAGEAVKVQNRHVSIILSRPSLDASRDALSRSRAPSYPTRGCRRPASTSEKYRWSARIRWSTTSIPMMSPAFTILVVSTRSSWLGVGSPDG